MQISAAVFERAKKLRRDALEELFAQVYPAVVRIARGLTGREDVAEGVVRFMMVRAVGMVPRWRDETTAERWFLHHTVLTARRAATHHGPDAKSDLLAKDGEAAYVAFAGKRALVPVQAESDQGRRCRAGVVLRERDGGRLQPLRETSLATNLLA